MMMAAAVTNAMAGWIYWRWGDDIGAMKLEVELGWHDNDLDSTSIC
jgi:hypothetical protein